MKVDGVGLLLAASSIVATSSVRDVCAYVMKNSCCLLSTRLLCDVVFRGRLFGLLNRLVCVCRLGYSFRRMLVIMISGYRSFPVWRVATSCIVLWPYVPRLAGVVGTVRVLSRRRNLVIDCMDLKVWLTRLVRLNNLTMVLSVRPVLWV